AARRRAPRTPRPARFRPRSMWGWHGCSSRSPRAPSGGLADDAGIALALEVEREILVARLDDLPAIEHVHAVGHDVLEQALVVGDDEEGAVGRAQRVDAVGDDLQRVDVEAGIGLVEHAELRLEQLHLK